MWRLWNYWLGGKDNYPVDRALGDAVTEVYPEMRVAAREYQAFLGRVVSFLAGEAGITQFLVIGTGFPDAENVHDVAQRINPAARVVYVDDDPSVLAHGRALLTSTTPAGVTICLDANVRDPVIFLAEAQEALNFNKPVAAIFLSMLGNVAAYDEARAIVAKVAAGLPTGSYLALGDFADTSEGVRAANAIYQEYGSQPYRLRTTGQLAELVDGLSLVEPGLVPVNRWRPGLVSLADPVDIFGVVARTD